MNNDERGNFECDVAFRYCKVRVKIKPEGFNTTVGLYQYQYIARVTSREVLVLETLCISADQLYSARTCIA